MSRYQLDNSPIYIDGSDVPKNRLGATDSEVIHEIENDLLAQDYKKFSSELTENTKFNKTYFIGARRDPRRFPLFLTNVSLCIYLGISE